MRKLKIKKLLAIVLSVVMCLSCTMAVSASDFGDRDDAPTRQAIGPIIATGSGTVYASGSIEVYLGSANAWADIKVGSDESEDTGSLSCYVEFPNGTIYNLGSILASGGESNAREFTWCPAGTYTFYFSGTMNVEHSVWAHIYD